MEKKKEHIELEEIYSLAVKQGKKLNFSELSKEHQDFIKKVSISEDNISEEVSNVSEQ